MAVRARPVARFLTVIWAPGTGAWLWSMTVPTMAPRKVCARAAPAAAAIRAVAVRSAVSLGMEFGVLGMEFGVAHERVAIAFMDGPPWSGSCVLGDGLRGGLLS